MKYYFYIPIYFTQAFMCVVCGIGIRKYKLLPFPLQLLEWYILFSIVVDGVKDVMVYHNIHTLWIDQCFSVLELFLFVVLFHHWRTSNRNGVLIWISFLLYLIFWIIGKFSFEPLTGPDTFSCSISQIIQIGFGMWLMLALLKDNLTSWEKNPMFWVISGIILYATASFFLFGLFGAMFTVPRQIMRLVYLANMFFIILQYIFFLRAFLCKPVLGTAGNLQS